MIGLNWPSEMDAESCRLSRAKRLIDQLPIKPAPRLTPSGPGHPGGNGIRIDAIGPDFRLQRHGKPRVPPWARLSYLIAGALQRTENTCHCEPEDA